MFHGNGLYRQTLRTVSIRRTTNNWILTSEVNIENSEGAGLFFGKISSHTMPRDIRTLFRVIDAALDQYNLDEVREEYRKFGQHYAFENKSAANEDIKNYENIIKKVETFNGWDQMLRPVYIEVHTTIPN